MKLFDLGLAALVVTHALADQAVSPRSLLESGKYDQAVEAVAGADQSSPMDIYVGALAAQRLQQADKAREMFDRLRASQGEDSPWWLIAASGAAQLSGDTAGALEQARKATEVAGSEFAAQYQLGLVLYQMEHFGEAAAALTKATQLDPNFAYAHFYAGTAYQKDKRLDKTSEHFEAFLRLAPSSPEAPAVQSIMRTLRGR